MQFVTMQVVLTPGKVAKLSVIEKSKRLAAFAAVDEHLLKEHKVHESWHVFATEIYLCLIGHWYWIWYGQILSPIAYFLDRWPNANVIPRFNCTIRRRTYLGPRFWIEYRPCIYSHWFVPPSSWSHLIDPMTWSLMVHYFMCITGFQSKELIVSSHLNLGDVDQFPTIDVTFDGADEWVVCSCAFVFEDCIFIGPDLIFEFRVDQNLNCIKGGGACHLREKVLAEAAKT